MRKGGGKYARLDRSSVKYPPTENNRFGTVYGAMCATLVRVEIARATGVLRIAKAYSVLECGKALVPEIVLGQAQGGFAMAWVTRCLRRCRLTKMGPAMGNGIRKISHRARFRPAAARSRNRGVAAGDA